MALPDIWHYHPDTGLLLGHGLADPSPADASPPHVEGSPLPVREDVWLIPAHATDIEPPAFTGTPPSFIDGAWTFAVSPAQVDSNITAVPDTLFGGKSIREALSGQ